MTAGENEAQALVRKDFHVALRIRRHLELDKPPDLFATLAEPALTPRLVDGLVPRRRCDPACRIARHPLARPLLDGRREGVLHGIFGEFETSQCANQRRKDTPI